MKRNFYAIHLLMLLLVFGCQDDIDHYEIPGTLGDRLVTAMEKQPDLSQFVKGIDMLDMREDLENSAYTVFPPTDEAVLAFIKDKYGASDITELPEENVKMIVQGHMISNSLSWNMIRRLYQFGDWGPKPDDPRFGENEGWQFKLPSLYKPKPYVDTDPKTGKQRKLWRRISYLPVFHYHSYCGIKEADDYGFLFPGSNFTGFNLMGAEAVRPNQRALNGFYHVLDKVIPEIGNLETFLAEKPEYSLYRKLLNRFARYEYTAQGSEELSEGGKDSVFVKRYDGPEMHWIADDLPQRGYDLIEVNNATIPTDQALESYLTETFVTPGFYGSIDDIPDEAIFPIIKNHLFFTYGRTNSWLRPVDLKYFASGLNEPSTIERDEVVMRGFTNNSVIYGIKRVLAPRLYVSALKPVAFDPKYTYMLKIANEFNDRVTALLTDPNAPATVFVPSNEAFNKAGYTFDEESNSFKREDPVTGELKTVSSFERREILEVHSVSNEDITDLSGRRYVKTLSDANHLLINKSTFHTGGTMEFSEDSPVKLAGDSERGVNGTFYPIDKMLLPATRGVASYILDDTKDEYSEFVKLLKSAEYVRGKSLTNLTDGELVTVLIPTNEALQAYVDNIPTDRTKLREFLSYFFIRNEAIFSDGSQSGEFETMRKLGENKGQARLKAVNAAGNLRFEGADGTKATVIEDSRFSNLLARGGTVHLIDNILLAD
ncbi:hypothetical protein FUAX_50800 (plasmid) [Fulvitalea axinellae]|uniref:FAS1 domain-containing protein n=1 Tax=Fulvitalea axinellae TaxID=1182444 RepID=A0AAU9CXI8_9BACT|nr:hypothetical protein FUAX_50800 [Fulvitalea axinellae]